MIEDLGEQQNTGIRVTRTRNSAGQNHYMTRRNRSPAPPYCVKQKFIHETVWTYQSPTLKKLDAMIREELR